jgi:RNA polymerase sigma-70 factor, ECF subfamily
MTSILHEASSGAPAAVRACVDRFSPLVWALARRYTPTVADAEDAVQEIFLDLWKSAARFDPAAATDMAFVAMIARRRLIDGARRRKRRPVTETLSIELHQSPSTGAPADVCVEARRAASAIGGLRPEQRDVLMLATVHGLTHEEIAVERGMPLGTVKAHARRGLIRIREMLVEGSSAANAQSRGEAKS